MRRGVARRVMSLTWCNPVGGVAEEMHALEGLISPLSEGVKGVGNGQSVDGSKVITHIVGVEHTRSWCLIMISLSLVSVCVDGAAYTSR